MKLLKKETEQNTQNKTERSKGAKIALKIANIVINVLIVIVLILSVMIATLALTSKANGGIPTIFGHTFHTIMSPSMEGGSNEYESGDYHVGDLVIGKETKGNTNEVYEIGDIVVYTTDNDNTPDGVEMIVHRVIAREDRDGTFVYTTKGDNNELEDQTTHTAADIVAVCYDHDYNGAVWRGFGNFLNYIRSSQGFFLVVLLPMIIFFLYEIIRVVMNAINYRNAKAKEEIQQTKEEQQAAIDAAVKAALAAAGKTDAPAAPAEDSAPEAPADAAPAADAAADLPADAAKAPEMSAEEYEEFKRFMAFKKAQEKEEE